MFKVFQMTEMETWQLFKQFDDLDEAQFSADTVLLRMRVVTDNDGSVIYSAVPEGAE